MKMMLFLWLHLIAASAAYADTFGPTIGETLEEWREDLRPDVGTSERLEAIGLSGRIWKLRNYVSADCARNVRRMVRRLEQMEGTNFDIRQAQAVYLRGVNGWTNYHVVLFYKGYFFDPSVRLPGEANHGDAYMAPRTARELFSRNGEPRYHVSADMVFMPAAEYVRSLTLQGDPPIAQSRMAVRLNPYSVDKVNAFGVREGSRYYMGVAAFLYANEGLPEIFSVQDLENSNLASGGNRCEAAVRSL